MSEESIGSDVSESIDSTEGESLGESTEDVESTEEVSEEETSEEVVSGKEPKYYKTVVNGREELVTLEELLANNQKARASAEKFQKAAQLAKQAEERQAMLKDNPVEAMKALGMSKDEIKKVLYAQAMQLLEEEEEEAKITPEQKRLKELEEENRKYREERENKEKEIQSKKEAEEIAKYEQEIEGEFIQALGDVGLSGTPEAVQRMAMLMYSAAENNYDMSAKEAAEIYKDEETERILNRLKGLEAEDLEAYIGKEAVKKLRQNSIAKIKNPQPKKKVTDKSTKKEEQVKRSMEEFFKL
jgi:hypothetical protein